MASDYDPSKAFKSVPVGKYRENHMFLQYRTMCMTMMGVPWDYKPTQAEEQTMLFEFTKLRQYWTSKGEKSEQDKQ